MLVYHRPSHTGQRFEYYTSVNLIQNKTRNRIIITILQQSESKDIPPPQDSNYQKPYNILLLKLHKKQGMKRSMNNNET